MLSKSDVEFYRENGYVVAPNVLDGAVLSKIRQSVVREDNAQTRGLIKAVHHLVEVEEVS